MTHTPSPAQPACFDHPNDIWWGVQIMQQLLVELYQVCFTFSLIGANIFLSILLSNISIHILHLMEVNKLHIYTE